MRFPAIAGMLALALLLISSSAAVAQHGAAASPDEPASAGLPREEAVALVLATDPRFAGLPDWEDLRLRASAEFRTFEATFMTDHFRVLGPTVSEFQMLGWVTLRQPASWLIETTLVERCSEPELDTVPTPDPCDWRHIWVHRVAADGRVTLLFEEGDPDPADT